MAETYDDYCDRAYKNCTKILEQAAISLKERWVPPEDGSPEAIKAKRGLERLFEMACKIDDDSPRRDGSTESEWGAAQSVILAVVTRVTRELAGPKLTLRNLADTHSRELDACMASVKDAVELARNLVAKAQELAEAAKEVIAEEAALVEVVKSE